MKALLLRDLALAFRSGGGFGLGLAFFFLLSVLVPLGVGPEGGTLGRIAPGILWVGALLACLLALDRIFAAHDPNFITSLDFHALHLLFAQKL